MNGAMDIRKIVRDGADVLVELSITESDAGIAPVTKLYDVRLPGYGNKSKDEIQQEVCQIITERWEKERMESNLKELKSRD